MKRKLLIIFILILITLPAGALYFQAQHWCIVRVNDAADGELANGKIGMLYKEGQRGTSGNPRRKVDSNVLMINAFILPGGWTVGDQVRMEVPEGVEGYKAGPTSVYFTTGDGFDDLGTITLESSVPVVGGPQLRLTVLLQGFYNPETDTSRRCVVEIEARSGSSPTDTVITGVATVAVGADGVGQNGFLIPAGTTIPAGSYYMCVRHKLPELPAGPNHMPVITANKVTLSETATAELDVSRDMTVVYRKSDTDPAYIYPMFPENVTPVRYSLKGGFSDDNDDIGLGDYTIMGNPVNWQRWVADGADIRADSDGDGFIGLADYNVLGNPLVWQTRTSAPLR
jgi:hypothetical protein